MNKTLIAIFLIFIIGGSGGLWYLNRDSFAVSKTFTPIYCNDYEFTSCYAAGRNYGGSYFSQFWNNEQGDIFTCSKSALYCKVNYQNSVQYGFGSYLDVMKAPDITKCEYKSGLFVSSGYECQGAVSLGHSLSNVDVEPGSVLYLKRLGITGSSGSTMAIETFVSRLDFCGTSACVGGVKVAGADQCTFQTNNKIYSTSGNLLQSPVGTVSYTVPLGESRLSWVSGNRHICGNIEEQCNADTDCGGHTYGNLECTSRTLQKYGCRTYSDPNTQKEYDLNYVQGGDLSWTKSRCEIKQTTQVQCCGDTDCGSNAFCDTNPSSNTAWTCQQNVQCTKDSQCGVSQVCDWTTTKIKTPICQNNQCAYAEKSVQCCSDVNCPQGYFCGLDNKCKESANPKQSCPFACCDIEPNYFDKPCPSGQTCCGDNTCASVCSILPDPEKKKNACEEEGGYWVEKSEKKCTLWVFCSETDTGYCRFPRTPALAIVFAVVGLFVAGYGFKEDEDLAKVFGFIIVILMIIWLILAGRGIL